MQKTILAITGRPGLFSLVQQGRSTLIVETVDKEKRRFSVGLRDRITSLNDVSMYTNGDDVSLNSVLANIKKMQDGKPVELNPKKATNEELADFMAQALPQYDRERVHASDIRKLIQWYNILVENGIDDFEEPAADEAATEA